jgi:hypothetical protein
LADLITFKTLVILIFSAALMSHAHSPEEHDIDQIDYPGMASLTGYFMASNELTSTLGTEEILFPVSGCIGTMAMGVLDIYGY